MSNTPIIDEVRRLISANRSGEKQIVVVGTDVAAGIFSEVFRWSPRSILITSTEDEIVEIDGISVKLRHDAPRGQHGIFKADVVRAQSCCDAAAMQSVLATLRTSGIS